MRRWLIVWVVVLLVGGAFVLIPLSHAQDEPYPISLSAGDTFDVCSSGQIVRRMIRQNRQPRSRNIAFPSWS